MTDDLRPRPFAHLIEVLHRNAKKNSPDDQDDLDQREKKQDEEPRGSALTPAQATALAQQICLAGAKRRGEISIDNPPPVASEASRFAGREQYVTPVRDPAAMAAAIIAAGKRRRGEAA